MNRTVHEVHDYDDVRAALANPDLVPELPAGPEGRTGASMAWLRSTVPRFSSGEPHARRRALVEAELARLDPTRLRDAASRWSDATGADVVRTLAEALGYREPRTVAESITAVAAAYFGGEDARADAAVELLVRLLSPGGEGQGGRESLGGAEPHDAEELVAARICLLVQACDATAALVRNARSAADAETRLPVDALLHATLRDDPPVRALRRVAARDTKVGEVAVAAGELVLLDATAVGPADGDPPLAFGAPPRVCPGRDHAMALAAGALTRHSRTAPTPHPRTTLAPHPSTAFARLHRQPTPLLLPNAWDCASAAALAAAGFAAVGTTSLGVAAAAGLPDGAGATAGATLALARQLGRGTLLFTVDMEGGFSEDPDQVAQLARELADAGAAGINLEDGRADGTLTPTERHAAKIAAVKVAAPGLFVNARTDTHWLGLGHDGTEERLAAYQQAGADGLFVPGLADPDRIRALTSRFELPLNVLYSPTGPTLDELAVLGVRRVSLGSLLYRRALGEAVATARAIRDGRRPTGDTLSYDEVQAL
ncbi:MULTISPECIES: isocitrate lyase/phosphoenolpyruvate mutase family protein [unclassified Streptomyces]|uniref:isocitrate lyase/phosphoenolpyruvate mutase family protein n=1 Tax=unclassified Streptomyces TaxID=2593676 RepID=UPI00278BBDD7|nr:MULTISPECIES: isocitrate lyase/phosphoenolpyruvate mutase family protein [unclassified Streptomyces]